MIRSEENNHMANTRRPGINMKFEQNVVDGTLCLSASPIPGPTGMLSPPSPWQYARALANRVKLDPEGCQIALFFGIGKNEIHIPVNMATLPRMLRRTTEGRTLLKLLGRLPWASQEPIWWKLSDRVSELAGLNGEPVHVYVSMSYYDRVFPDPAELAIWWAGHKNELIDNDRKEARAKNIPEALTSAQLEAYRMKLDSWSQEDIEAQYYAIKGKNRFSGSYEDEIFHKIESLNIGNVHFHALDDATGREVRDWFDTGPG